MAPAALPVSDAEVGRKTRQKGEQNKAEQGGTACGSSNPCMRSPRRLHQSRTVVLQTIRRTATANKERRMDLCNILWQSKLRSRFSHARLRARTRLTWPGQIKSPNSMCRMGSSPPPRWDPVTAPPNYLPHGRNHRRGPHMNPARHRAPSNDAYPSYCCLI
ncbi:unnamed protein product [Musa acuminata subsp. burmannicoides]